MTSFHPVRDSRICPEKQEYMQSLTGFQEKVCRIVKKIPKGRVLTYKEVAQRAGRPGAWRAAGNILNKNRDKKIPCHRVIKSNGKIGGYNQGIKKKIALLKKENVLIKSMRIVP